jgi:osmotically inducible protein OsmC
LKSLLSIDLAIPRVNRHPFEHQVAVSRTLGASTRPAPTIDGTGPTGYKKGHCSMALEKAVYTARATTTGGRAEGHSKSSDGKFEVRLNPPKELGGSGEGTNPEQIFAAGYSACFLGAIKFVAGQRKISLPRETSITADVSLGPRAGGAKGYSIAVAMQIDIPGMDKAQAQSLVDEAHEICPYSNATRGNIDVALSLV